MSIGPRSLFSVPRGGVIGYGVFGVGACINSRTHHLHHYLACIFNEEGSEKIVVRCCWVRSREGLTVVHSDEPVLL